MLCVPRKGSRQPPNGDLQKLISQCWGSPPSERLFHQMTEEARNHRELLSLCCSRPQTQGLQDKDCSGSQMQQVRYRKVVIQVMVFLVASTSAMDQRQKMVELQGRLRSFVLWLER